MSVPLLIVQLLLVLLLAPLLQGVIKSLKAACQNRQGPCLLQPTFDILKLLKRESVVSEHGSWIYHAVPYVYLGAYLAAAALVPTFFMRPPLEALGDAIVVVGLFALARFALALAALDTASNFGGMGMSRELAFAALVEPALLLALFALAIPVGSTGLVAMAEGHHLGASLLLAFGALFVVAIAETGRIPIDNPDTHLELTMAHEGMILEYSGRPLGLIFWGAQVKQLVVLSLIAALTMPWGIAPDLAPVSLLVGLLAYVLKVGVLGAALALVESGLPKLRVFRVPDLLGAASLLALLAVVSLFVVGGLTVVLDAATARDAVGAMALLLLATGLVSTVVHRLTSFITILTAQGVLLGGCALVVALASGEIHAWIALVVTIGVKVIGVPTVLTFALRKMHQRPDVESVISHKLAFVLAVGLALLAYLVAGPLGRADAEISPNALPAAVALLLIGLLTMAIRGSALTQVVGLVMSENGIYLAAIAVTQGLPLAVELGVALDILIGVLVMGLVAGHIERIFTSIDTDRLKALRG